MKTIQVWIIEFIIGLWNLFRKEINMPTTGDVDRQNEIHEGDTGEVEYGTGGKFRRFRNSLVSIIIVIVIAICCVFAALSTQQWFIEWLKGR